MLLLPLWATDGFPAFSASANSNNATVGWPASFDEAAARPVYSILNLEKLDAGT